MRELTRNLGMLLLKGRMARLSLSLFFGIASYSLPALAMNVTPQDQYKKLIRLNEDIHLLSDKPFGKYQRAQQRPFNQASFSLAVNEPAI